jgi:hypothetical protein
MHIELTFLGAAQNVTGSQYLVKVNNVSFLVDCGLYQEREDFLHDTLLKMAKVKAKYELIGKLLTEAGLMRVASYQVAEYWVKQKRLTNGLDCGNCSKEDRRKCCDEDLYSECPKYKQFVSLDTDIDDGDGDKITFAEFIADDKAIDLDAWLDAKAILRGLPKQLIQIGYKRYSGIPLTNREKHYFNYHQRKFSLFDQFRR